MLGAMRRFLAAISCTRGLDGDKRLDSPICAFEGALPDHALIAVLKPCLIAISKAHMLRQCRLCELRRRKVPFATAISI